MANGIPVRLSSTLAKRARKAAQIQNRSLTEQVEHWARLGQSVETSVLASTVARLKTASYDERLPKILAAVDTPAAQARAARSIARKNPKRYGTTARSPKKIMAIESKRPRRAR